MLDEIIDEMFEKMASAYRKPYIGTSVVDFEQLPAQSIVLFDHFVEYQDYYKLMLDPRTNYNFREKLSKQMDSLFRHDFDFMITDLDAHMDKKLFGTYRIHGIIGLILEWIDNDFDQPPAYMAEQLIVILRFYTPKIYVKQPHKP